MNNSNDALSLELQKNDVGEETTLALRSTFMPFFEEADELAKTAKVLVVTSENQTEEMDRAREMRLEIKAIRIMVDKNRKNLKEEVVRKGKAIDGMANIIKFLIVPVEEHLQKQEDFVKIREARFKEELRARRDMELRGFDMSAVDIACYNLAEMSEDGYQQLRDSWKMTFENKLKLELEVEEKRIAAKKAEAEERAILATENLKLKAEHEEADKKAKEKLAKEKAKLKTEREERQGLSAELKAREEAEELQKREAQEAFRKAGLAPDKDKLWAFATTLSETMCADLESEKANAILKQAHIDIGEVSAYIRGQCIDNL